MLKYVVVGRYLINYNNNYRILLFIIFIINNFNKNKLVIL